MAASVLEHGGDEDTAIAALLHDAVEDQGGGATAARIRDRFGDRVADMVLHCSDSADLVVEWYDFGAHAPYESANLLIFDAAAQDLLASAMGAATRGSPDELARAMAQRFHSYFAVRDFAKDHAVPFRTERDFWP